MSRRARWTLAIVSIALFMTTLDNLVVSTALPSIRTSLGASIESLEWTVNAYTLAFAVLLLTGAALGDRFGRRRMFIDRRGGVHGIECRRRAGAEHDRSGRGARSAGRGGRTRPAAHADALSEAVDESKRGLALGIWSGVSGLGVALGPLVGGAVVNGLSWEYIFWLNVPIGIALIPLASRRLDESYGPDAASTCRAWRSRGLACWASSSGSSADRHSGGHRPRSSARSGSGSDCSPPSSCGSCVPPLRCSRCVSSARVRSARRTASRSRCSSARSGRSSCCRSSSRQRRATRRSRPGC